MARIYTRDGGYSRNAAEFEDEQAPGGNAPRASAVAARWLRHTGAAVSLALIAGVVVWGYRLSERAVEGIPVLRAPQGPARIAPEDPGGDLARHVGLSVNEVAGSGMAAPGPDRVTLAPAPEKLSSADAPMTGVVDIPQVHSTDPLLPEDAQPANQPTSEVPAGTDALAVEGDTVPQNGADDSAPDDVPAGPVAVVAAPEQPFEIAASSPDDRVPDTVPGIKKSPRPVDRPFKPLEPSRALPVAPLPEALAAASAAAAAGAGLPAAAGASPKPRDGGAADQSGVEAGEIDPAKVAKGTRLVQLGAFDSPETARAEWARLAQKFSPILDDKTRIIEESTSGGRKFYRLRAMGYDDVEAARRFCAALVAQSANCIPTVAK